MRHKNCNFINQSLFLVSIFHFLKISGLECLISIKLLKSFVKSLNAEFWFLILKHVMIILIFYLFINHITLITH